MRRHATRTTGFTLIEVLLATALLAAGLALAFATLGAATRSVERGEAIARHNDRVRTIEGFLRQRLVAARPVAFATDAQGLQPLRFVGDGGHMRFVADLPAYLGQGGPYLHDFAIVRGRDGSGVGIELSLSMVLGGQTADEADPWPPDTLVEDLHSARFRYRGLDADGRLGGWQEQWRTTDRLPQLVEVSMTGADGQRWPPLVVALPLADNAAVDLSERF